MTTKLWYTSKSVSHNKMYSLKCPQPFYLFSLECYLIHTSNINVGLSGLWPIAQYKTHT